MLEWFFTPVLTPQWVFVLWAGTLAFVLVLLGWVMHDQNQWKELYWFAAGQRDTLLADAERRAAEDEAALAWAENKSVVN